MKTRKLVLLTAILLMGLVISSTITIEAKGKLKNKKLKINVQTFYFDGMEYENADPDPPRKEWIDRKNILHIIGGAYYFYVAHEYFGLNSLICPTRVLRINLDTGIGRGIGSNIFTGVSYIPGFEGLEFEMRGISRLFVEDWYINGWARSRGTIGEYRITMDSEFGPVFEGGMFVGTYLRGTITIYVK